MFTNCSFDATKSKPDCYIDKNFMERFCKGLKEHAAKINNYEKKKEMIPLTDEEDKYYKKQKFRYICKIKLVLMITIKRIIKSEVIVFTLESLEELLILFGI